MQRYPAWKMNILIFVAIAAMVAGYSFWQVQQVTRQFLENAREHAQMVAAVVEIGLDNAPPGDPNATLLLERLNELPGIASLHLQNFVGSSPDKGKQTLPNLVLTDGRRITETLIPLGDRNLVVSLPAGHFTKRVSQMKSEFLLFALGILFFGCLSTWWLYRTQQQRIEEARDFERRIARQHEEAALGRAASTIAHEIRNPLNAIGMGLQRLEIEADRLAPEHLDLVSGMREAVARSNAIISHLKQYVGGFQAKNEAVDVASLLSAVIQLYQPQCDPAGIAIDNRLQEKLEIAGDRRLLGQLFENLIKNAVEAQPHGGRIAISAEPRPGICRMIFENDGFMLGPEASRNIFEPYFTTKTTGTGLGLAISKKIVEAHGGRLVAQPDLQRRVFRLVVELPIVPGGRDEGDRLKSFD
jgi:signal transduction histidine kinase